MQFLPGSNILGGISPINIAIKIVTLAVAELTLVRGSRSFVKIHQHGRVPVLRSSPVIAQMPQVFSSVAADSVCRDADSGSPSAFHRENPEWQRKNRDICDIHVNRASHRPFLDENPHVGCFEIIIRVVYTVAACKVAVFNQERVFSYFIDLFPTVIARLHFCLAFKHLAALIFKIIFKPAAQDRFVSLFFEFREGFVDRIS